MGNIPGLQTTLHEYQRRTVSTMVARETRAPGMADSPLYLPVLGVDGRRTFFFQPATMELVADRKHVPVVPGGILCEELGTWCPCAVNFTLAWVADSGWYVQVPGRRS